MTGLLEMSRTENTYNESEGGLWQAFLRRDGARDGDFVVAVTSTGIYCKPSCPSRRPKRENVKFYDLPEAAEQAGFRPCKRCKPQDVAANDPQVALVRDACHYIDAALDEDCQGPPALADIARHVGRSPHHFQRIFKRYMGISPRDYADARRLDRLKTGLRKGDGVADALYGAGYGSSSRVYERAPGQLGMTPATYAKGGKGAVIGYTAVDCALGRLMVAATETGICMVCLGDDDATLQHELESAFPAATLVRDEIVLDQWVKALIAVIDGSEPHPDLPLDIRGTAFQWRVWQELMAIPAGETRTYKDIAERIGNPKAVRAVGRACATNPTALTIPCHRAIRQDGSLSGYRWGLKRKQVLLETEKAVASGD